MIESHPYPFSYQEPCPACKVRNSQPVTIDGSIWHCIKCNRDFSEGKMLPVQIARIAAPKAASGSK
jgi:ribosomal protein L37AE/L43A